MSACINARGGGNAAASAVLRAVDPRGCGSRSPRWFCVQAHWRMEDQAALELGNQGFATCFPRFLERTAKGEETLRAMFPSYLFVQFDPAADQWRPIVSTRGVRRLFSTPSLRPIPVPHGVVEAFLIHPDAIVDARPDALRLAMIPVGTRVKILSGPFADLSGVCSQTSQQRVSLLMDTLAGRVSVTVPRENVEAENAGR